MTQIYVQFFFKLMEITFALQLYYLFKINIDVSVIIWV